MIGRDYAAVRAELRRRPLLPYERLESTPRGGSGVFKRQLDSTLVNGWQLVNDGLATLSPPVPWKQANRSFEFDLHSWRPINDLLHGFQHFGDRRYLDAALAYARDWVSVHQEPLLAQHRASALVLAEAHATDKAWYDVGVGHRAYRLAYLADVVGHSTLYDDQCFATLLESVRFHLELLGRESFFRCHNNHGLYQTLGQLAAARRFRWLEGFEAPHRQATERLTLMFERSFFESGVHREHSPGYHYMILGSLTGARASGLLQPDMDDRLAMAEKALAWMIGPQGVLATMGDTDFRHFSVSEAAVQPYQDAHVRFLLSGGRTGSPPPDGMKAYDDAGAVFVRSGDSYLAQTAAFHSRTHKHADHLSFLWWDGGEEVLIDPGRFGYLGKTAPDSEEARAGFWYSDPRRMYVETTRAHNCVEVDGQDYPRRNTKPFGSALQYAARQDDLYVTTCEVRHFRTVRHRRDLVLHPGHFLLVLDWLYDRSGKQHDFEQWFQVAPQWDPCPATGAAAFISPSGQHLWVANLLDPVAPASHRGETAPRMSGWRSDGPESLVPTTSLNFSASGERCAFATLFLMGAGALAEGTRTNQTLSAGRFVWSEEGGKNTVSVTRSSGLTRASLR